MSNLKANQEAFVNLMLQSDELAQRGFDLLLKRQDFEKFFDVLNEHGLFGPSRNPSPQPADKEGYFTILYWNALDYLVVEIARLAGKSNDRELAGKVLDVVHAVTTVEKSDGQMLDNYQTARRFAEIIGLVPVDAVSEDLLDLISIWLKAPFDRGRMVGHALNHGFLVRALESTSEAKLVQGGDGASALHRRPLENEAAQGEGRATPRLAVEDHAILELIQRHVPELGRRVAGPAAALLLARVRGAFCWNLGLRTRRLSPCDRGPRAKSSLVYRRECVDRGLSRRPEILVRARNRSSTELHSSASYR